MHNASKIKILCSFLGGSHLYKLNTAQSDEDLRGVFIMTDPSYIIGLNRHDEERRLDKTEDRVFHEFQHWMRLLRVGNTEALECLFAKDGAFSELTFSFNIIRLHAYDLIDSERFYKSLRGYALGEYSLALGKRTGLLGSKRQQALKQYGFSPKNCTNLLRLLYTGIHFFKTGQYIVNCHDFGDDIYNKLFQIKTKPDTYSAGQMERDYKDFEAQLDDAFVNRKTTYHFNEIVANWLIVQMYYPYLKDYYENKS